MAKIKPVSHSERLSVVDHLDELRTRLFVALGTFAVAFILCFWQNKLILDVLNGSLPAGVKPVTLGVTEPLMVTVTVSAYAALLLSLPIILFQLYSYVLPAFKPSERRLALPFLLLIPVLFLAGAVFSYLLVIPAAVKFLLHFNAAQFNIQIRSRDFYSFTFMTMFAVGLVFQLPIGMIASVRLGLTSADKIRSQRRIYYLVMIVIAAALPGTDPVTMLIEAVPLIALFELGLLLASWLDRPTDLDAENTS